MSDLIRSSLREAELVALFGCHVTNLLKRYNDDLQHRTLLQFQRGREREEIKREF